MWKQYKFITKCHVQPFGREGLRFL